MQAACGACRWYPSLAHDDHPVLHDGSVQYSTTGRHQAGNGSGDEDEEHDVRILLQLIIRL